MKRGQWWDPLCSQIVGAVQRRSGGRERRRQGGSSIYIHMLYLRRLRYVNTQPKLAVYAVSIVNHGGDEGRRGPIDLGGIK
jgi:hypothetical protein